MTKVFLTIAAFLFACLTFSQTVKNDKYILTIKIGKIEKQNDQTYWAVPVTLTNNSAETLKYFSMSCSWQDFYSIDNNKLQIETAWCEKNVPIILVLAPRQVKTVELRLLITQTMDASEIKFKIGFNLMKASSTQNPFDFNDEEESKKKNVIWSNVISM